MLRLPFLCPDFLNRHDTGEAGLVSEVLIGADDGAVRLEPGGGVAGVVGLEQPLGESGSGSGFPGIPVGHGVGQVDVGAVPGRSGDRFVRIENPPNADRAPGLPSSPGIGLEGLDRPKSPPEPTAPSSSTRSSEIRQPQPAGLHLRDPSPHEPWPTSGILPAPPGYPPNQTAQPLANCANGGWRSTGSRLDNRPCPQHSDGKPPGEMASPGVPPALWRAAGPAIQTPCASTKTLNPVEDSTSFRNP